MGGELEAGRFASFLATFAGFFTTFAGCFTTFAGGDGGPYRALLARSLSSSLYSFFLPNPN